MKKDELRHRTKKFGLRAIKLVRALPKDVPGKVLANQLMRSAMSVGANYRSACRGRSKSEWLSKLGTCLEEADESAFWLEMIMEDGMLSRRRVEPLWKAADELCAIFYSAICTGRNPSA